MNDLTPPTPDDIRRYRQEASKRPQPQERAIHGLLVHTGIRVSELVALNVTDIRGGQLHIAEGKEPARTIELTSASTQEAVTAWKVERAYRNPDTDALFLSQDGARISRDVVVGLVRQLGKWAGIDIGPAALRRARQAAKEA